jgi:hypothetical protein
MSEVFILIAAEQEAFMLSYTSLKIVKSQYGNQWAKWK